jgi:hypothetical protein
VHAAGGYPLQFGTISVSDGISMGHEGMHFSLVSREVIADSVEVVMQAERLDGSVLAAGCDKSLPGMLMAAARLDLASVFLYAGSLRPDGCVSKTAPRRSHHHRRLRSGWCLQGRQDERGRPRPHRARHLPGRRCLWRYVHRKHHGLNCRSLRHEPSRFCFAPQRRPPPRQLGSPFGRSRGQPDSPRHHRARHSHQEGLSKTPLPY